MSWRPQEGVVSECVVFNGYRYRRYPESPHQHLQRYFWRSGGRGNSLHRDVWEYNNGDIPEGHHIHHVDEDFNNNDVSNLECLPSAEHFALHSEARAELGRSSKSLDHLGRIREKAAEWHRSEEGRQWHREVSAKAFAPGGEAYQARQRQIAEQKANPVTRVCTECGEEFPSPTGRATICSQTCASKKSRRKRRKQTCLQPDGS